MTSRWTSQNFNSAGESSRKGKQNEKEIEVLLELDDHQIEEIPTSRKNNSKGY